MERRTLILILPFIAVILVSGCTQTAPVIPTGDSYTLSQVSEHSQESDCWLIISGRVYDVTGWVPTHPGGEAILQGCGKDATNLYETRPMGSGTPHSQRARELLQNYFLGDLET